VKCDKTTEDPKKHTGPFKLLRVEADGLRVARCNGCGSNVSRRPKSQPELERRIAEWTPNDLTTLFNTDLAVWEDAWRHYSARPDGGPIFRVLEGHVWGIPRISDAARFKTSAEAERTLLAAGFKLFPELNGFNARPEKRAG
jgi:hypothetical protein